MSGGKPPLPVYAFMKCVRTNLPLPSGNYPRLSLGDRFWRHFSFSLGFLFNLALTNVGAKAFSRVFRTSTTSRYLSNLIRCHTLGRFAIFGRRMKIVLFEAGQPVSLHLWSERRPSLLPTLKTYQAFFC